MSDERPTGDASRQHAGAQPASAESSSPATTAGAPPAARAPRKRRWGLILLGIFVLFPILVVTLWTVIALSWPYSSGDRAGYVQKFSHKGWLCKTWEGELAMVNVPGAMQDRFTFSVRDDSVAQVISRFMGSRVSLHYEQHRGVPFRCFGDTEYFVTGVRPVGGP